MKRVGIITFHNSYNCGSMMESYAIQRYLLKQGVNNEIIDFSNEGQREMYSTLEKNKSLKKIIKNIIILPFKNKIDYNNRKYEEFKLKFFKLSKNRYLYGKEIEDKYDIVIAGSDQIWNITIPDSDDAYFLDWCHNAKKIAYAPSFGARNIQKYSNDEKKYISYLNDFDALSIREENGKKWLKEMIKKDVPVLIDPTLLLSNKDYDLIIDDSLTPKEKYIFFYAPSFDSDICKFVKKLSKKYNMKVLTWSSKSYYKKFIYRFGFELIDYESPAIYLSLIKNAELVLTTSFHGTIFSTIYRKKFFTLKNGGMYGDDDRVITLLKQINMNDRLIEYKFDNKFDYMKAIDYKYYENELSKLQKKAEDYLYENVVKYYNEKND
ncbi:MAG: polysaccharide pyruvyl transferase family protein [Clostridia bacterium]